YPNSTAAATVTTSAAISPRTYARCLARRDRICAADESGVWARECAGISDMVDNDVPPKWTTRQAPADARNRNHPRAPDGPYAVLCREPVRLCRQTEIFASPKGRRRSPRRPRVVDPAPAGREPPRRAGG